MCIIMLCEINLRIGKSITKLIQLNIDCKVEFQFSLADLNTVNSRRYYKVGSVLDQRLEH